jgi:hypothetical protein
MRVLLTVLLAALTGVAMADPIEEPKWEMLQQFDNIEIRQYALGLGPGVVQCAGDFPP